MDKIEEKWGMLRANGLDLGNPLAIQDPVQTESARRYGGAVRQYERGNIYWHPIMGTEAREVHGGILGRYLSVGGPGESPVTHQRILGFPKADERKTRDGGLYPVSYFELGAIYWFGAGAVLHGDLYHLWENTTVPAWPHRLGSAPDNRRWVVPFGYPIDDQHTSSDGQVVFFESGCWWKGPASNNQLISFSVSTPLIGRPAIWNSEASSGTPLPIEIRSDVPDEILTVLDGNNHVNLFSEIWRDRLLLQRVVADGQLVEEIPIECTQSVQSVSEGDPTYSVTVVCRLPSNRKLSDRALYNIIYQNPETRRSYLLAAHAIYSKSSWDNFGIMHATDMHVSRRLEGFRALLQKADYPDGIARYNCFNDNFREVIRYANHLYDIGVLDLILATGDLVDYIFEDDDNENGRGNFAYFVKLLLGSAPSSVPSVSTEELRVPIFTVPGNHDYRKYPYKLHFKATAEDPALRPIVRLFGRPLVAINASHNLTRLEALAIDNDGVRRSDTPVIAGDKAGRMVEVDEDCRPYFQYVNDASNYLIRLGKTRIAMLNTKYDIGIIDTDSEGLEHGAGLSEEDEEQFATGSPNSVGIVVDSSHNVVSNPLEVVRAALMEADETGGTVIVGMHAPPFNISGNENAFYFRETQHAAVDWRETVGFLLRRVPASFVTVRGGGGAGAGGVDLPESWFDLDVGLAKNSRWVQKGQQPTTSYFMYGNLEDLMEYSVSKGQVSEFLQLCLGQGTPRQVELVLCGHLHYNVEFRLGHDSAKGFLYNMDFYTTNPQDYYATYMLGSAAIPEVGHDYVLRKLDNEKRRVYVEVTKNVHPWLATPKSDWWDHNYDPYWRIQVPAYEAPLNEAGDARDWWMCHRPLIIQTGGVGPLDTYQRPTYKDDSNQPTKANATFQGFRVILIRDNTISRIRYVRLAELREKNFEMPWEPPDIRRSYREVFGRDARADELAGWLNDPQTEGKSYEQVVSQHMEFLVSARGSEELREMIKRSYWAVFGREPVEDEILTWVNAVKTDGKTYDVIVRQHVDYMLSAAGSQELEYMVRRSYLVVLGREPSSDELAYWKNEIMQQRYQYWQLVEAHNRFKAGGGS